MKKLLILLGFLMIWSTSYASVYLTYDKASSEIIDVSPREDVVLEQGWERIEMSGTLQDYNEEFQYHPSFYKYKNGKLVANISKLSDQALEEERQEEILAETIMIDKKIKEMAIAELKGKGKVLKHYTDDGKLKEE